jgi:tetratricopeptide (TPR) repeat protein
MAIGAAAVILVAAAVVFARHDAAVTPPSQWMVDAAVALNRSSVGASPHWQSAGEGSAMPATHDLAIQGQQLRVQRRFAEAQAVYLEIVKADPMDADAWAHLADCQAAAAGKDLGKGRDAIMHALAIDPHHRKALWLRASLELQDKRYAAAAATWRELAALVPAGSSDARVIAANIAEADALAGTPGVAGGQGS